MCVPFSFALCICIVCAFALCLHCVCICIVCAFALCVPFSFALLQGGSYSQRHSTWDGCSSYEVNLQGFRG